MSGDMEGVSPVPDVTGAPEGAAAPGGYAAPGGDGPQGTPHDGAPAERADGGGALSHKHEVQIYEHESAPKMDEETRAELISAGMMPGGKINIKGVSSKMLRRMKREYVDCPVLERDVQFLKCFVCSNFQSRVRGKVLCMGNSLEAGMPSQG